MMPQTPMPISKILCLSLLAICLNSRSTESKKLLRRLGDEDVVVVCLTEEQCRQKFRGLNNDPTGGGNGGYFRVGDFPTKGCFSKVGGNTVYFGTGGTDEKMSKTNLPGIQERILCERVTDAPTMANPSSKQPTLPLSHDEETSNSTLKQLVMVGNNGWPTSDFPLGLCEGDCDNDSECLGNLSCFQRDGTEPVPGCAGVGGSPGNDYCYERPASQSTNSAFYYEAEDASFDISTSVRTKFTGAKGNTYVNMGGVGSWVEFNVDAGLSGGVCTLSFRYANGAAFKSRPCSVQVNGSGINTVLSFATTSRWNYWSYETIETTCTPGTNVIRITSTTSKGGPNLDSIYFSEMANLKNSRRSVGVYYYPWHGDDFHRGDGYLRRELQPPQLPALGEYDDTNPAVIRQHLQWSRSANINLWVTSWWGPGGREDNTIKNVIMPHPNLPGTRIALFYETMSRLKVQKNYTTANIYSDVEYMAKTYFDDPNYMRIDGRPVLFVYLTRVLSQEGKLEEVTTLMRQAAMENGRHDLYIMGDQVMGDAPRNGKEYEPFTLLDGVTNYDIYGNLKRPDGYAGLGSLNDLASRNSRWRDEARAHGNSAFVPCVSPGYNDRGVRYAKGHAALSRKLYEGATEGSLFRTSLEKAMELTEESTGNMIMINSWNEWHEDTQIEPVVDVGQTDQPLNLTCYGNPCDRSLNYEAYGELYLDILRNVTSRRPKSSRGVRRNMVG